jgi:ATP-dependent RNA helicase DHX37/DHR1
MAKFVPRERKHRRLEKTKQKDGDHVVPNAESHVRSTESEKDERRRKLKSELTAHAPDSKVVGKKKKRLDKYIDTKLRNDENMEIIK